MSPADSLQFLDRYGVVILPALAVAEQIGIPLPAVPALLAVGALAAHGRISIPLVLGAISVAALAIDFVWYELGRRRGARVLVRLCQLCQLSLEADSCLRRAESTFARYGARSMLAAKFIPGLTTVMPPLAGVFAVTRGRFALYDLAGVLLWAGTWLALGYFFSDAIVLITAKASALGRMLGLVIVTALAGYILVKYGRRRLLLRKLRTAPVSPEALKRRLDAGDDVTIIDLRTALDVEATPYAIPGGRWLAADAIDEHEVELLPLSGRCALLRLTQRHGERPGGASAETHGNQSGPSARGRTCGVDGPESSRSSGSAPGCGCRRKLAWRTANCRLKIRSRSSQATATPPSAHGTCSLR